jgi:uncharacterized protein (PEP-CTERM system associated)
MCGFSMERRRTFRAAVAALLGMASAACAAGDWRTSLSLTGSATLTDNVDLAPKGQEETDLYLTVTPSIGARREGARLKANVVYAPSLTVYASSAAPDLFNSLYADASLEAVQDFFFVDANASIYQTFLSPFGSFPSDVGLKTDNRTETYTLSVSPYIKGRIGAEGAYEVRNRTTYTADDASLTNASRYVSWSGRASAPLARRWSWTLEGSRDTTYYTDQRDLESNIARLLLTYRVSPDLALTARAGYEHNNYGLTDTNDAIYGVGLTWTPTPRTLVNGYVEDRYFGTSYNLSASHRRRLSAFTLYGSRDVSTYPQQLLFTLPPGDARSLMNAALTARIPDPVQRQAAVQQLLTATGTPNNILAPTTFYTEQANLVDNVGASIALLGVRNSVVLSVNWVKNQPISQISGQPLPPQLQGISRYETYGAAVDWSLRLTARTRSSLLVSRYYTEQLDTPDDNSTNTQARYQLVTQLSRRTTGSVGVRWTEFNSNLARVSDYTEHAIFATASHNFY